MNKIKKLRVAVIGVGVMGNNHARVYSELQQCELVAVSDLKEENAIEVSEKFRCRYYLDHKEMLDKENIEAVSVAVPTRNHKQIALDVINRGVNLLLEKPIAGNVEDAEEIIRKAKENNVKLLIGHIERFNPAVIKLKKIIDDGKLGMVTSIIARRVGLFPSRVKDANIVIDVSVHDIDIMRYLMDKEPDEIYVLGSKSLNSNREDQVVALMKFGDANGVIQSNWITPIKIRNLSVTGTKGYAELNYMTQELTLYESNYEQTFDNYGDFLIKFGIPNKIEVGITNREPLKAEIEHFLQCISENQEPIVDGKEALESLRIALDINEQLKKLSKS